MSIELQTFRRTRIKIQAVKYEGPKMDYELSLKFKNDFCFAYDYMQDRYLTTERRGLKNPHTGDWLIFDDQARNLIDVMPDDIFQKTYETAKGGI
ncbi:MAG: hypothetical protein CVV54_04290 [Synergistetes bacterium HGW-Synergistetes-1]|nr:MAG: hypothetical protein CVV54_04290 [Synergistetes bacterium HGW-Synergistetes-1]